MGNFIKTKIRETIAEPWEIVKLIGWLLAGALIVGARFPAIGKAILEGSVEPPAAASTANPFDLVGREKQIQTDAGQNTRLSVIENQMTMLSEDSKAIRNTQEKMLDTLEDIKDSIRYSRRGSGRDREGP